MSCVAGTCVICDRRKPALAADALQAAETYMEAHLRLADDQRCDAEGGLRLMRALDRLRLTIDGRETLRAVERSLLPPPPIQLESERAFELQLLAGEMPRATLWPFLTWILVAFLAGAAVTFLAIAAATSAGAGSSFSPVSSGVAAARASWAEPADYSAQTVEPRIAVEEVMPVARKKKAPLEAAAVEAIIRNAFVELGQDPVAAIAVAKCESSLRPDAIGDGGAAVGLFQWHLGPWLQHASRLFGHDVGDRRADPVLASLVTAYTVSRQGWGIWTCKP